MDNLIAADPLRPAGARDGPADRPNSNAKGLQGMRVDVADDVAVTAGLVFETQLGRDEGVSRS